MKELPGKTFLFVNLSIESGYYGVNHGIAYLVPIIRKHSFEVSVLHLTENISTEKFREAIETLNPSIVGYSCTSLQLKYLAKYSRIIKDLPYILQIAGGVGPTLDPERFLLQSAVDGVVIGEGEIPLESLLNTIRECSDIYGISGFFWIRDGKIVKNEMSQFILDLDQLDYPDYRVFDRDVVQIASGLNLMVSRGCPYSCNYCSNHAIRKVYPSPKGYFRLPSVEYAISLTERMIKKYPQTTNLNYEDDLLIANKNWFLNFSEEYRKRICLPYRINVRIECIDEDITHALKESGCNTAFLGLESGNEKVRKLILNRHHSNSEIVTKSRMLKKSGIKLFTFNMVGLPFETKENLRDTLVFNKRIGTDCGSCTFFYPFPNTKLFDICKEKGLLKDEQELQSNFNTRPMIRLLPQQEKETIKIHKKLQHYFAWRDIKYDQVKFRKNNTWILSYFNFIRLLAVYYLKRLSSPYRKKSLYRRFMDNKFRLHLWALLRGSPDPFCP